MIDRDEGGDPACWAHLELAGAGTPEAASLEVDDAVLAALARGAGDGIIVADRDGRIVFWNAAAERIFGWSAADAVGTSLDLIIPERHRGAHWAGYAKVMETGQTRYGTDLLQVPAVTERGERISIAFTVSLLADPVSGAVRGIAAIVRDDTARRAELRELRERISALEAGGAGATTG
jgi:PAS domain S-box-containing protein